MSRRMDNQLSKLAANHSKVAGKWLFRHIINSLDHRGTQRCTHSSEDNFSMSRKLGKMPGGLYVWTRSSWTKSNTKSGNERNTKTLSEPPGMKLRKTKPRRAWIWPGVSKTTSRAPLTMQGTKGLKKCVPTAEWGTDQQLSNTGQGQAEVLNTFFISASASKTSLQESQAPGISEKGWNKEDVPLVEEDLVTQYLSTPDLVKSRGSDAPMSAERMAWCHCHTMPNHLSYITSTTGTSTWRQK